MSVSLSVLRVTNSIATLLLLCFDRWHFLLIEMMFQSLAFVLALVQLALAAPSSNITTTTTTLTITSPATTRVASTHILPATKPTSTNAAFNLAHSAINEDLFTLNIADRAVPIKCVDCSTTGSMEVFVHNDDTNSTSFFKQRKRDLDWPGPSGSLIARFPDGINGHVELSLSAPKTLSHDFTLLEFPLLGVSVPGFGIAGVVASLTIPLSLELSGEADLTFGFNFSIPRNASLGVHFPFIEDSTSYGFTSSEGMRMDSLPVTLSTPGLDVSLTTGLRLELSVGVSGFDDDVVVKAGARLDLPK